MSPAPHPVSSLRTVCRAALAAVLAGCAADSLVLPSEGEPAEVAIVNGNQQQGTVGGPLADSLAVRIADGQGRPVVNVPVAFEISGGGSVQPVAVVTDGQGEATFRWTLGPIAGSQSLSVGVGTAGSLSPKATFTAAADAGAADSILRISGNNQFAQAGSELPESLVVQLHDAMGNPVPGVDVVWQTSNGSVSQGTVATNAAGFSSVAWTLGPGAGQQTATAQYPGAAGSPVSFSATATATAPPRLAMVIQPSSTAQSGVVFAQQPSVRLETSQGAPITTPGVAVTAAIATGGGSLGGTTTVNTDAAGVAQFTDLFASGSAGNRTLIFAASGHTTATSAAINLTSPAASGTQSTLTINPATIQAGNGASTVTVTARDAAGNPVPGANVIIAASGSGNTVTQPAGVTNASGVATGSVSSTGVGTKTVSATIGSVTVSQTGVLSVIIGPPAASQTYADVPDGKRFQFTTITIFTRDAFGNDLTQGGNGAQLKVSITGANRSNPNVVDQNDGTYTASYFPFGKGDDFVSITLNGVPIQGSPYTSKVK